jgi:hypothetical protein
MLPAKWYSDSFNELVMLEAEQAIVPDILIMIVFVVMGLAGQLVNNIGSN